MPDLKCIRCVVCKETFLAETGRCCSSECEQLLPPPPKQPRLAKPGERRCETSQCERPHYARGLCRSHYKRQHEPRPKVDVPCATCGQTCTKYRDDTRQRRSYCSYECRADRQFGTDRRGRKGKSLVHVGPAPTPPERHAAVIPPPPLRVWVAGGCAWCMEPFVGPTTYGALRYCSTQCAKARARHADRQRSGRFTIAPTKRLAIYQRDQWTCQLCGGAVDATLDHQHPMSATLDHIRCQAWGEPDHSPTNLRLAHRICNSIRSDESHDWRGTLTERGLLAAR